MNNQLIQEIFENKINFYIFKLKSLTETETEMLIEHLKSKITIKSQLYERLMKNEIEKVEQMEEQDYNKYITIMIQYLINENKYTISDIQKIIEKVQTFSSLLTEMKVEENTYNKIDITARMNNFIYKLNLTENEDTIKYIKVLTTEMYEEFRSILFLLSDSDDINELLTMIIQPYIKYKYESSEKFIADDLIYKFLYRLSTDKFYNNEKKVVIIENIVNFLTNDNSYLKFLLKNNDIAHIYDYMNVLKTSTNKVLGAFRKELHNHNQEIILQNKKTQIDYSEHLNQINISGLNTKKDKDIIKILYFAGKMELKTFLKELNYQKYYNDLQKINILTYQKLENTILTNKLIKLCRQPTKKILPGKVLKTIIFTILNKNDKLELVNNLTRSVNSQIRKLEMNFELHSIQEEEEKEENNFSNLKIQRTNIQNLILLLKENNEDTTSSEYNLININDQIQNFVLNCDTEDQILDENINELTMYLQNNTSSDRVDIARNITGYRQKLVENVDTKYGQNFVKNEPSTKVYNQFDQNLTNIIEKIEKEDKKEENELKKKHFIELQNNILTSDLEILIKSLDRQYNGDLLSKYEMISDFLKYKMKDIMSFIYKNLDINQNKFNKNKMVYSKLRMIINTFLIISICMKKDLDINNIYDTIDNVVQINKPVKKLIIKCNNKEAELVEKVGDYYIVKYLGEQLKMQENEITLYDDLKGKNCKIIKGHYKGTNGCIFEQKNNFVSLTKDLYGKTGKGYISGLPIIKLPLDHIKIDEELEKETFIIENKELFKAFNKKSTDLYSLTKFILNKSYKIDSLSDFDLIFKFTIELFNKYKVTESEKFNDLKTLKTKYLQIKTDIKMNKTNKRVYINLNKELKKVHMEIRTCEKTTEFIKDSLFNNIKNLNNNYIYNKTNEGIYQLNEYTIKSINTNDKTITKEYRLINKKMKVEQRKQDIERQVNSCITTVTDLLADLLF